MRHFAYSQSEIRKVFKSCLLEILFFPSKLSPRFFWYTVLQLVSYILKILTSKGKRKMSSEDVESRESLLDGQPNGHAKVVIERPVFSQQKFDEGFSPGSRPQTTFRESFLKSCRKCQCSKDCFLGFLYKIFPFIGIMKDYNIRTDLTGDIVSGLTVGIMHIPQGEAVSCESYKKGKLKGSIILY